ncbi:MAG: hypothetical protein ACK6DA_12485 [Candidatus Kapaibacterium sp.]|jgi:hypothetical protein
MQNVFKIIYWLSILFIVYWIIEPICSICISFFITIEISDEFVTSIYSKTRLYGVPVAILLTLCNTVQKKDNFDNIFIKTVLTLCVSFFSIILLTIVTVFGDLCKWTTNEILFENVQHQSTKIVRRSLGCGAFDSSPDILQIVQITNITSFLVCISDIDTNVIDKNKWKKPLNVRKHNIINHENTP